MRFLDSKYCRHVFAALAPGGADPGRDGREREGDERGREGRGGE